MEFLLTCGWPYFDDQTYLIVYMREVVDKALETLKVLLRRRSHNADTVKKICEFHKVWGFIRGDYKNEVEWNNLKTLEHVFI